MDKEGGAHCLPSINLFLKRVSLESKNIKKRRSRESSIAVIVLASRNQATKNKWSLRLNLKKEAIAAGIKATHNSGSRLQIKYKIGASRSLMAKTSTLSDRKYLTRNSWLKSICKTWPCSPITMWFKISSNTTSCKCSTWDSLLTHSNVKALSYSKIWCTCRISTTTRWLLPITTQECRVCLKGAPT